MADTAVLAMFELRDMMALIALSVSLMNTVLLLVERRRTWWHTWLEDWDNKAASTTHNYQVATSRIQAAEKDIAVLQEKMLIFWKGVAYNAAMTLHSPHTPEFDILLEKFRDDALNDEDVPILKSKLQEILADKASSRLRRKTAREALLVIYMQYEVDQIREGMNFHDLFRPEHEQYGGDQYYHDRDLPA